MTEKLTHIRTPSLPHLLALLAHPPPNFPPKGTSLLVVDSVSAPFPSYFPNATEIRSRLATASSGGKEQQQQTQWLLNRKRNVASDLASHAAKLASTRGLAVVLLNQTHTKIRGLPRPTLYPALATGGAWESCIATRIVIYREFFLDISGEKKKKVRFAEMMKKGGKVLAARTEEDIVRFIIDDVSGFLPLFFIFAMLMLI
jgi:RecA/RadA recombinase